VAAAQAPSFYRGTDGPVVHDVELLRVELMRHTTSSLLAIAFVLLYFVPADAASVGLNFRRGSGEQDMAASESAGVVPQMNWNNSDGMASGDSGANISGPTAGALVDDTGAAVPGLSITWTSNGTWSSPNAGAGDLNLMSGYVDDTGSAGDTVLNVSGIPYAHYDVYAYLGSDGNDRSGRTRLFDFVPNDRWLRTDTNPFVGFVEATATTQPDSGMGLANYVHYQSLDTSSFDLKVLRGSDNVGLHGIQIVETDGSAAANWSTGSAPAAPASLLPGKSSVGLNFVGGRADTAEPDGFAQDDGIVAGTAGAPGVAQSNWNNLAGPTGSAAAGSLVNHDGTTLASTNVSWDSNNVWTVSATAPADSDGALMKGYLDTNDTSSTTVEVSGLPSQWAEYDVYVYFDGDSDAGRAGNYTISSSNDGDASATEIDTANWDLGMTPGGTYNRANENASELVTSPGFTTGNYLVFPGRHDLSFTLTAMGSQAAAFPPRAPINAIQLVATSVIPEPMSLAIVLIGTLAGAATWRRRSL
jgi:hypothetical protein